MVLPADSHVHSEWSWDTGGPGSAAIGSMRRTCARALRIGLPALVFTEHLDFETSWRVDPEDLPAADRPYINADGYLMPPLLDVDGYLESIERCRREFPDLRILTGVEWGQPHLTEQAARAALDLGGLDRVNGSLHTLPVGADRVEPVTMYKQRPPQEVVRAYLAEVPAMAGSSAEFEVFTHLDYAVRQWPSEAAGPFDPAPFEEEFRTAMRAIARSGRALEMNTRRLAWWMPQWWREEGGRAVAFGSDAHTPETLADGLAEAAGLLALVGFHPGRRAEDFWTC